MTRLTRHTEHARHYVFFRYCDNCEKRFQPNGKDQKLCDDCQNISRHLPICKKGIPFRKDLIEKMKAKSI